MEDLKKQLAQVEAERSEQRDKYAKKLEQLEREWREEVDRIKANHQEQIKSLMEGHEADLQRIRRIKETEIESINSLQNQGLTLDALVQRWQANADQISKLHQDLIAKQDQLLVQKVDQLEVKVSPVDTQCFNDKNVTLRLFLGKTVGSGGKRLELIEPGACQRAAAVRERRRKTHENYR